MAFVPRFSRREDGGYDASYGKSTRKLSAVIQMRNYVWTVTSGFGMSTPGSKKLSEVKEGWGAKAAASYGSDTSTETVSSGPPRLGPPSLRSRSPVNLNQIASRSGPPTLRTARGQDPIGFKATDAITPDGERIYEPSEFAKEMAELYASNPSIEKADEGVATCPSCGRPITGWREEGGKWLPPCRCDIHLFDDYEPCPFDPRMYEDDADRRLRHLSPIGVLDKIYAWMSRNREYVMTEGKLDAPWSDVQEVLNRTTGYAEYREERWHESAESPEAPDVEAGDGVGSRNEDASGVGEGGASGGSTDEDSGGSGEAAESDGGEQAGGTEPSDQE